MATVGVKGLMNHATNTIKPDYNKKTVLWRTEHRLKRKMYIKVLSKFKSSGRPKGI